MIKIALIRHSKTNGNLEKRYIGITDESLCKVGIDLIKSKSFPLAKVVYCSPLARCLETSKLIYKDIEPIIYKDLKECNFGLFENKNYKELIGNIHYKKWINSNGTLNFPNGESSEEFKDRCVNAFDKIINDILQKDVKSSAMIVHGGTIMAILDRYSLPHEDFYHWQVNNCEGFVIEIDEILWIKGDKRTTISEVI
ncbi:histidine phosphatase family protein [Clostridium vincentii]|uniref:Alpha-ribazole phosphatase n=1 Tax=Clostridium vincentii TaxID=52704 RepID=A0A2T0BCT9_9CLOT|nr:histidine phosphatase family protein [Clostridium vincentii]PRR81627.1 Alpha-ribazole phosphatase [Clostridium vincentii]